MRAAVDYEFILKLIIVLAFVILVVGFIIWQFKPNVMAYIENFIIGGLPKG